MADAFVCLVVNPALVFLFWAVFAGLSAKGAVRALAMTHRDALGTKWLQTVRSDAYGGENYDAWFRECRYFMASAVSPRLSVFQRRWLNNRGNGVCFEIIGGVARVRAAELSAENKPAAGISPVGYEAYCAEILRKAGWSATLTKRSGDQGADVIAERGHFRVVLQCKLHSQPVGNGAVQEALAAKLFYRADAAAVVSNAAYTPSAQQLAGMAHIPLLHDSQLDQLDQLCDAQRVA